VGYHICKDKYAWPFIATIVSHHFDELSLKVIWRWPPFQKVGSYLFLIGRRLNALPSHRYDSLCHLQNIHDFLVQKHYSPVRVGHRQAFNFIFSSFSVKALSLSLAPQAAATLQA